MAQTEGFGGNSRLLPLFPLRLVVFPGSMVPLHIFEPRYRKMVGEAAADGTEFGVVLAKDRGIVNIGCTVLVEKVVQQYPDGRFDVVTRGQRRFEIGELDQEEEYLRARVAYYDDDDTVPASAELRAQAIECFLRIRGIMQEATAAAPDPEQPFLSFQLAQDLEDLDFRTILQRERSERERLRRFIAFVEEFIPRQEYSERLKRSAPQNGFGHKPLSM